MAKAEKLTAAVQDAYGATDIISLLKQAKKAEYDYCRDHLIYWANNYGVIEDKDSPDIVIPFKGWAEQNEALLSIRDNRLNIILKARQLGITWIALLFCTHDLMFNLGHTVVALSKTEDDAKELVRRVKVILTAQSALLDGAGLEWTATAQMVTITDGKLTSTFKSFPASPGAGRSFTANILLLDEWAFQEYAAEIWDSAYPTINRPGGGKVIGLSTIKLGSKFYDLWTTENNFNKIFIGCFADPRRTKEWYEQTAKDMGIKVRQEYPRTAEEALANLGGAYFHEFDYSVHTCEPFEIPEGWRIYSAMDYGLDMLAHYKFAVDGQNNHYCFHEIYKSGLLVTDAASKIHGADNRTDDFGDVEKWLEPEERFAPPDLWQTNNQTGKSIAIAFAEERIELVQSSNNVDAGCMQIKELLKLRLTADGTMQPRLKIFRTCTNLIRCIQQILIDEKKPNRYANEPHELTHSVDALRYYAVQWIRAAEPPQEQRVKYTPGQLQDYYTADEETRKLIIKRWGYPIL